MTRLYLVRHGHAAAGWDASYDPGLDDVGRAQAEAMAASLAVTGPLPVVVSPLRRTRETAGALERVWGTTARVDAAVGELVAPTDDLAARSEWLREFMRGSWDGREPQLVPWRAEVVDALLALNEDTVVVTHFVAINVAVGHATSDDRVVCFRPANCSVTVLESDGQALRVVELGAEAETRVL